jgi:hypothetical protein
VTSAFGEAGENGAQNGARSASGASRAGDGAHEVPAGPQQAAIPAQAPAPFELKEDTRAE